MNLPPWLAPQDFVGAMQKGASLGLSRRGQDLAAQQHAAALALQRDQMEVAQQQHAAQFVQSEAHAAEALRQNNALEAYRMQSLAESQRTHDLTAASAASRLDMQDRAQTARDAHAALMEGLASNREERQAKAADDLQKQVATQNAFSERRLQATEDKAANPKASTVALRQQMSENATDLRAANKDLVDPEKANQRDANMARVADLEAKRSEIEQRFKAAGEDVVPSAARVLETTTTPDTRHGWFNMLGSAPISTTALVKRPAAIQESGTPPLASANASIAPPSGGGNIGPASTGKIRVRSADGKQSGTIPASELQSFLDAGWERVSDAP